MWRFRSAAGLVLGAFLGVLRAPCRCVSLFPAGRFGNCFRAVQGCAKAVPKAFSYRIQMWRFRSAAGFVLGAFLGVLRAPCRCVSLFPAGRFGTCFRAPRRRGTAFPCFGPCAAGTVFDLSKAVPKLAKGFFLPDSDASFSVRSRLRVVGHFARAVPLRLRGWLGNHADGPFGRYGRACKTEWELLSYTQAWCFSSRSCSFAKAPPIAHSTKHSGAKTLAVKIAMHHLRMPPAWEEQASRRRGVGGTRALAH